MITAEQRQAPEEVFHELLLKAASQKISAKVYGHLAEVKGQLLIIPVFIAGDLDAFEFASQLQDLEDSWNNQNPKPDWHIILRPASR